MDYELLKTTPNLTDAQKKKVADFVSVIDDIGLDDDYKQAGLIYFAIKAKLIALEDVENKYGKTINSLVATLQKLDNLNYAQQDVEAENLRKMFFAITKDIRTIMLKIALVVAEARNINLQDEHLTDFTNSIMLLYAPLAARLGLSTYKTELEETAFKLSNPDEYAKIQQDVDSRYHEREPIVAELKTLVENCMKELQISGRVFGRKKHIYSIYKKLKSHPMDNIYDLVAVRAIVNTVAECYALLGRLHSVLPPMEKRFKDYIAIPKPNGYQSLHTTVIFKNLPVEIQIRTDEMNKYAEYGVAAHWIYKEKRKQDGLDARLGYIRLMMETENVSVEDLASSLDEDIYGNDIFVQSPKGKVIYLPNGSTPIDFAYQIHSEVGNHCVGAKVNGKIVPMNSTLNNGDVVEIITSPNSKGPSRDWLKFCKTSDAKSYINSFFKKNTKDENIRLGRQMLESTIKDNGYSVAKLMIKPNLDEILSQYNMLENEFFANIGTNALPVKTIANKLKNLYLKQIKRNADNSTEQHSVQIREPKEMQIKVKGLNNILLKFANCCHPMFGDDIVGFVSASRGIIIHRSVCPNISFYNEDRLIDVSWIEAETTPKKKKKMAK